MAILDGKGDPILIVSMDLIDEIECELADAVSQADPGANNDKEIQAKKDIITRLITSDSWEKRIRIPVLITDTLNVQMVGSNASTGKTVTYINREPITANLNNNVSVELTLKNNIGDLSVISDVLSSIFTRIFTRYTTSARASFFGHNVCIFNGYLTGINRQTVGNTDKERLNLTFERANDNPSTDEKFEEPTVPDDVGGKKSTPAGEPPFEIPNVVTSSAEPIFIGTSNANSNAGGAVGDRVFLWYNIGGYPQLLESIVPEVFSKITVNRLEFTKNISQSFDFNGVLRQAITIIYNGVNIPIGVNGHFPYYQQDPNSPLGYAATIKNGWIYLGLEVDAS